jgi:hypothetical protein
MKRLEFTLPIPESRKIFNRLPAKKSNDISISKFMRQAHISRIKAEEVLTNFRYNECNKHENRKGGNDFSNLIKLV